MFVFHLFLTVKIVTCFNIYDISNMVSYHPCRLQDMLKQKMNASGYMENAPKNVLEEDMRRVNVLSAKLDTLNAYNMKLDTISVEETCYQLLSSEISTLCKMESWPDMGQLGRDEVVTLDQLQIEERFLAFLRG